MQNIDQILYNTVNMQENEKPTLPPVTKPQKNSVQQVSVIKRSKISNYPYYPVTFTLSQNGYAYIFNLDLATEDYAIIIIPFKFDKLRSQYIQMPSVYVELDAVPRRNVNFLYVLQYKDEPTEKSVAVKLIDFVIGFSAGFLIRCRYTNSVKGQKGPSRRELNIIGKYNKKPQHKQGFMARMSSTFFSTDEFYKVAVQKPVRSFRCHSKKYPQTSLQKYHFSYLIGARLYFCKQFSQQTQSQALKIFSQLDWSSLPTDTLAKLHQHHLIAINSKRHRTIIASQFMLIQWADQIADYFYTPQNELIVADNQENKILVLDMIDNLKIKASYRLDLDVKKINYFKNKVSGTQDFYLVVLPYDTSLFVINLTKNQIISLIGHKSYITQAFLTQTGYIITGGCDHRIGLKYLRNVKQWSNIKILNSTQGTQLVTKHYDINSSSVVKLKMGETYFLGQFNNVNSQRNNSAGYGFGNFLPIQQTNLYAFITYDFIVKVYKIYV